MRARGEIAYLAEIARPDVGVITNVAGAHLETLGSIEEVARAKGELFATMAAQGDRGQVVLPVDDPLIAEQAAVVPARAAAHLRRARRRGDVRILDFVSGGRGRRRPCATPSGGTPVVARLPLAGLHNARNARRRAGGRRRGWGCRRWRPPRGLEQATLPPHRAAPVAARAGAPSSTTATTPTPPR